MLLDVGEVFKQLREFKQELARSHGAEVVEQRPVRGIANSPTGLGELNSEYPGSGLGRAAGHVGLGAYRLWASIEQMPKATYLLDIRLPQAVP